MLQRKIRSIPSRTARNLIPKNKTKVRPIRVADPVRFRTGGQFQIQIGIGNMGNREAVKNQDDWKPHTQTSRRKSHKQCCIGEPPKYARCPVEEISEDKRTYRIIIEMPYHEEKEIKVEITADVLIIESTKSDFNYYREFLIPSDVLLSDYKQNFQNGIFTLSFEKEKKEAMRMFRK